MQTRARVREWIFLGAVLVLVAVAPLVFGFSGKEPSNILRICIYAILALGLNVVLGLTGQLDLGYVAFIATGAVITAVAMVSVTDPVTGAWVIPAGGSEIAGAPHRFHFPGSVLAVMLVAGAVCALLGVVRGFPTLKLTGDYYAIVTLGLAEILYLVYRNSVSWTGGPLSLNLIEADRPALFGQKLYYDAPVFYYLVFAILLLTVLSAAHLRDSRVGRALAAIRLDPIAARTCGIPVNRYKMLAFATSGFIGGVGGSLLCLWGGQFVAGAMDFWESILCVSILVLGGMGSIRGALLGALVMVALGEVLRENIRPVFSDGGVAWESFPQQARFLAYGLILILLMRFRPAGVLPDRPEGEPLGDADRARLAAQETPLFRIGGGGPR